MSTGDVKHLMSEYFNFHNSKMTLLQKGCLSTDLDRLDVRFLVFRPDPNAGIGSIMLGLASSLLYAIVSGRLILVDWKGQIGCQSSLTELFGDAPIDWDFQKFKCSVPNHMTRLEMNSNVKDLEFYQCTKDFVSELSEKRFLLIVSSYFFVPVLQSNRMYSKLLGNAVFDNWMYVVSQHFFKLNSTLNKRYVDLASTLFRNETNVLGVHLRRNLQDSQFYETNKDLFWKCIREMKDVEAIYLATDDLDIEEEAAKNFRVISVPRHLKKIRTFREKKEIENAVLEMFLFRNVKDLMITDGSAYSLVVSGLTGIKPVVVDSQKCVRVFNNLEISSMPFRKQRILC